MTHSNNIYLLYFQAQPAHYHDALFGQYEKYEQHLKEDHKESNQGEVFVKLSTNLHGDVSAAHIPTFVAARIRIETPEWQVTCSGSKLYIDLVCSEFPFISSRAKQ